MQRVTTIEGFVWEVDDEAFQIGRFQMPLWRNKNGQIAREIATFVKAQDGSWRMEETPRPKVSNYGDEFESPSFPGWEVVDNPNAGKLGDIYVCIDPNQGYEFRVAGTPTQAKSHGAFDVDPALGPTKPNAGWRIYRKKKILGAVRLMPSKTFSQPLPLP